MRFSCPGKIILSGEHAVVYGKPALVAAVDLQTTVDIEWSNDHGVTLIWEDQGSVCYSWDQVRERHALAKEQWLRFVVDHDGNALERSIETADHVVKNCIGEVLAFFDLPLPMKGIVLKFTNELPIGRGLGSSAALACVTAGAATALLHGDVLDADLEMLTHECEKRLVGTPSGVDGYVVTHGGIVHYTKGKKPKILPSSPLLKKLFLVDAGQPIEHTGQLVAFVREKLQTTPTAAKTLDTIAMCTLSLEKALHENDHDLFLSAINHNQSALEELGVVAADVLGFCDAIEAAGGAAKIVGAGGKTPKGGGVILVAGVTEKILRERCEVSQFKLLGNPQLGVPGFASV